jgi:DNA primase large subunit
MSPKEIFNVFTTAPDFKGDIVRYQIEHITGSSSATSYHTPNCETMKSGGVCFNPDGLCEKEWLNSPLYYYKLKGKKKPVKAKGSK